MQEKKTRREPKLTTPDHTHGTKGRT